MLSVTDIILELVRAVVLAGLVWYLWRAGKTRFGNLQQGWRLVLGGFLLLLFGSVLDFTDNFDNLNRFVVIGDTETEAFLEKFVGFLGGFVLLFIGMVKWIPNVQGLSDLIDRRTDDLKIINSQLIDAKHEADAANQAKSEFLASMSHELRTPLTSIKGALGLLNGHMSAVIPDDARMLLEMADRNSNVLLELINDLLDYEKIISGKMVIDTAPHDLQVLACQAIADIEGFAVKKNISVAFEAQSSCVWANVNAHRFEQVMQNLLSNALKFSSQGAIVTVLVYEQGDSVGVLVQDCGIGIADQDQTKIFERFIQVDGSDTRHHGGSGLGLPITKALVECMHGTISCRSELAVGSTFKINFAKVEAALSA